MAMRRILFEICLFATLSCLLAGFVLAGQWILTALALVFVIAFQFAIRGNRTWLPTTCLVALVLVAGVGILLGCSPLWMICGAAATLAAWDLAHLDRTMRASETQLGASRFERVHVRYLGAAILLGLSSAVVGGIFNFQLPFIVLLIIAVVSLYSLDQALRSIRKKN